MQMAATKRWTLDELHRLPDDGNKYELVFGELFVTPPPAEEHENILACLSALITPYVHAYQLGAVFHPRAVIRFEGSEAEPDLFVRPTRTGQRADWDDAPPPLLVVEVLSPTTRRRDLGDKRDLYLRSGAREYWIVDPDDRSVRVVTREHGDAVFRDTLPWSPAAAPPLTISLLDVFGSLGA